MEKFLEKSIEHVRKIFPSVYENRTKKGSFHWALALDKNKIIAVGVNQTDKVSAKSYKIAKRLGLSDKIKFPYCHAEEALIGKLIGMGRLSSSLKIVVLRMNVMGKLGESAPCSSCSEILQAYSLNRIWWSNREGKIENSLDKSGINAIIQYEKERAAQAKIR